MELGLPLGFLIVLIARDGQFVQPTGATSLLAGDRMLALTDPEALAATETALRRPTGRPAPTEPGGTHGAA